MRQQHIQLTIVGVLLELLRTYISYSAYQFAQQELEAKFYSTALNRFRTLEGEVEAIVAMKAYFLVSKQEDFHLFTVPFLNTIGSIQALE